MVGLLLYLFCVFFSSFFWNRVLLCCPVWFEICYMQTRLAQNSEILCPLPLASWLGLRLCTITPSWVGSSRTVMPLSPFRSFGYMYGYFSFLWALVQFPVLYQIHVSTHFVTINVCFKVYCITLVLVMMQCVLILRSSLHSPQDTDLNLPLFFLSRSPRYSHDQLGCHAGVQVTGLCGHC